MFLNGLLLGFYTRRRTRNALLSSLKCLDNVGKGMLQVRRLCLHYVVLTLSIVSFLDSILKAAMTPVKRVGRWQAMLAIRSRRLIALAPFVRQFKAAQFLSTGVSGLLSLGILTRRQRLTIERPVILVVLVVWVVLVSID